VLLALPGWSLSAEVLYQENFDRAQSGADLSALGWRVHATPKQSTYIVHDGVLHVTCMPETYRGGYAEVDVPVCRRGAIEFDAITGMEQAGNARGLALTLTLYNMGLWWHDYCRDWRRYFPEPVRKRMPGFNVEPVGHKSLATVRKGKWHHYRVLFDTDRDLVEYYLDDMVDPVHIDSGVPVLGRAEWQGGVIRIGNMGITNGPVIYGIDNIVLRSLDEAVVAEEGPRQGSLVFRGIAFERYRLREALGRLRAKDARTYSVVNWRAASEGASNTFKLDRMPSSSTVARAKTIVLVDMPAGPDQILPDFLLEQIADSVETGGRLVVLGGMFALEKGRYQGTPLARILPVELGGSPWQVTKAPVPLPLDPPSTGLAKGLAWDERPCVLYYHALPLRDRADVLMKAGGIPILVRRAHGDGEVVAFLGTPCGRGSRAHRAFWDWKDWPVLMARMIGVQ